MSPFSHDPTLRLSQLMKMVMTDASEELYCNIQVRLQRTEPLFKRQLSLERADTRVRKSTFEQIFFFCESVMIHEQKG